MSNVLHSPCIPPLNHDVLDQLCSQVAALGKIPDEAWPLLELSMTSRVLRELCRPLLFCDVTINHPWLEATTALQRLSTHAMLRYARNLRVKVWSHYDSNETHEELAHALLQVLQIPTRLEQLSIFLSRRHCSGIQSVFSGEELILPHVRQLFVGPGCDFIVSACPGVKEISGFQAYWVDTTNVVALLRGLGTLEHLHHLELQTYWDAELLRAVVAACPTLENFHLMGPCKLEELIPILVQFEQLHTLVLSNASQLSVGFCPVWFGMSEATERQRNEAHARIKEMLVPRMPSLKTLWVGDWYHVQVLRGDKGGVKELKICGDVKRG